MNQRQITPDSYRHLPEDKRAKKYVHVLLSLAEQCDIDESVATGEIELKRGEKAHHITEAWTATCFLVSKPGITRRTGGEAVRAVKACIKPSQL